MRIKMGFSGTEYIKLKKGFVKQLQGLIYNFLDNASAKWLHDNGFSYEKRRFKMFTFSSILEKGRYLREKGEFLFPKKISFYVSSPADWILEQVASNFLSSEEFYLGKNRLSLSAISVIKRPVFETEMVKIKALTPLTIRSGNFEKYGKKFHTFSPFEEDFSRLIGENAKKKWEAFYKRECGYELKILPFFDNEKKYKRVVYYGTDEKKRTVIEGWSGEYILQGKKELLSFLYDTGLGERNSQGFGMWDMIKDKNRIH